MACFLITIGEAVVTTAVTKALEAKEKKESVLTIDKEKDFVKSNSDTKIPFSRKLKWLNKLLWGGSFLLTFEHIWHGEIIPWFPFLTAAGNAADTAEMLHEMATVGVSMATLLTVFWLGMVVVSSIIEKRTNQENISSVKGETV